MGNPKQQHHQRHAPTNPRNQNIPPGNRIPALDPERPPRRQPRQRQRRRLLVAQMRRALFQLPGIERHDVGQRARGIRLGATEDGVALGVLGAVEAVFPPRARVEHDALVEPGFGGRGPARRGDDADAVGEEGHAEGCAGVQVLADEEVAVVEGGGGEGYDGLVGWGLDAVYEGV